MHIITEYYRVHLTLTAVSANSADDLLVTFFLFFLENRTLHLMQIVSFCRLLNLPRES